MGKINRKYGLLVFTVLSLFFSGAVFINQESDQSFLTGQVCLKNTCFVTQIADTIDKQKRGLMFRDHLDGDKGMLFVFKRENQYPFWMKNTLIPLDIIWINKNQEVVFISENIQPCRESRCPAIKPDQKAQYVLEVNSGTAKVIDLKIGDKVFFKKMP